MSKNLMSNKYLDLNNARVLRIVAKGNKRVAMALCPFCNDCRGHLEIDLGKHVYYCHRCGAGGVTIGSLREGTTHITPSNLAYPPSHKSSRCMRIDAGNFRVEEDLKPPALIDCMHRIADMDSPQYKYLVNRGLSHKQIAKMQPYRISINQSTLSDLPHASLYIWFPVFDRKGKTIYAIGRLWDELNYMGFKKYLYPIKQQGEYGASDVLYGIDRLWENRTVVLTEGIFDTVWGPNRVAILGSHPLSDLQLRSLKEVRPKRIIVCMDGDDAGRLANIKIRSQLANYFSCPIRVVDLPDGEDLDSLGREGKEYLSGKKEA